MIMNHRNENTLEEAIHNKKQTLVSKSSTILNPMQRMTQHCQAYSPAPSFI